MRIMVEPDKKVIYTYGCIEICFPRPSLLIPQESIILKYFPFQIHPSHDYQEPKNVKTPFVIIP